MPKNPDSCRLYLISPPSIGALEEFAATLRDALSGGDVGAFQLRLKLDDRISAAPDDQIKEAAEALMPVCREYDVAFILNDRPDLAKVLGCDGVHLGQEDLAIWSIERTRILLGEEVSIGVSCHDSMHLAMEAGEQGADYVAFGAFHPTQSKAPEKLAKYGMPTSELVQQWSDTTVIPNVCIGGMTPENCGVLVQAGADFIAAITSVWQHPNGPAEAVSAFNAAIEDASQRQCLTTPCNPIKTRYNNASH